MYGARLRTTEELAVSVRLADGHHGAARAAHDACGDAAQEEVLQAAPAVRAHDDEVDAVPQTI